MTADKLIRMLGLAPHPAEGAYFRETYRAQETIPADELPAGYRGPRSAGTAIYYLLTHDTFSAMHRVRGDELFHFYLGDPVEMLQLGADGDGRIVLLGPDLDAGMRPQLLVPAGFWQGARVRAGGHWALLGTTMSPGFEYADFEVGSRHALVEAYPRFRDLIIALST